MTAPGTEPDASPQVSFDDEPLVLVDEANTILGFKEKAACHVGEGILHRAFSVFLFDERGRFLLQKRAAGKPLWPLFWSNSVCSHPRRGEDEIEAVHRRVVEEVGTDADVEYVYRFTYHAHFEDVGSERENCAVYLGRVQGDVVPNANEIDEWSWIEPEELDRRMQEDPAAFSPWMKMEWAELRSTYRDRLQAYL